MKAEERKAIARAKERQVEEKCAMYVHRSDRWSDVYFVSTSDVCPASTLIHTLKLKGGGT